MQNNAIFFQCTFDVVAVVSFLFSIIFLRENSSNKKLCKCKKISLQQQLYNNQIDQNNKIKIKFYKEFAKISMHCEHA